MNLKDRLENIRTTNVLSIKGTEDISNSFDVEQVFLDSDEVKRILVQAVEEGKNILYVSHPTMENFLLIKYFKQLFSSKEADVVFPKNLFDEVLVYENRINLIPSPSISELIHILEKIMYGYKSFVFGFTLGNNEYSLEKIKAAISLNCHNLSKENVELLLGTSDLILVNFEKNLDGLYFVSKIDKVFYDNYKVNTLTLFDSRPDVVENKKELLEQEGVIVNVQKTEELIVENVDEVDLASPQTVTESVDNIQVEEQLQGEDTPQIIEQEDNNKETTKKRNKYSVLKEKVKKKKSVIQE